MIRETRAEMKPMHLYRDVVTRKFEENMVLSSLIFLSVGWNVNEAGV